MRDVAVTEGDKVEAAIRSGFSVNTYGVNDLVAVVDGVSDDDVTALVAECEDEYDVRPQLRAGGERHESLRYAARQELALRQFLEDGGFTAFTTNFQDLGGLRQLPGLAVTADGRRLRFRRRGRLEDLGAAARAQGDVRGTRLGTSFMEDYTYHLGPGEPKILGAHMLEVCPTITRRFLAARSIPCRSVIARTPSGWYSPRHRAPDSWPAYRTPVTGSD